MQPETAQEHIDREAEQRSAFDLKMKGFDPASNKQTLAQFVNNKFGHPQLIQGDEAIKKFTGLNLS